MYDEEEEITSTKINIPKYRIIQSDIEVEKKENISSDNMVGLGEKLERLDKSHKKEEKNLVIRILECNEIYIYKLIIDATLSLDNSLLDKEIATKLKRKLDEDPDLNHPSVTQNESNILNILIFNI